MAIKKKDVAVIIEALNAGLTLQYDTPRGIRRFCTGDIISGQIVRGAIETKHYTPDMRGHIWIKEGAIVQLAAQARDALARKDELLAKQQATVASMCG